MQQYNKIYKHYEQCYQKYGDNAKGVDWPNETDASTRYKIMLDIINLYNGIPTILDFGCGLSHLYKYIINNNYNVKYYGLDISEKFIHASKAKFPDNTYYCLDILHNHNTLPMFDFIILNGVFTEKIDLSHNYMLEFLHKILNITYLHVNIGIAFNVMSKTVDWERDDLFYVGFDEMSKFITRNLSKKFVFRMDYGLYEYTTYVYK